MRGEENLIAATTSFGPQIGDLDEKSHDSAEGNDRGLKIL